MTILGIESSCDETSIGIVRSGRIVGCRVYSQNSLHSKYGGIMPELASRAHLERIVPLFKSTLADSGVSLDEIDGIGVTNMPGLKGSLLVGVSFAAGLAYSLHRPLYLVNHLHAHIAVNFKSRRVSFPALGLVVSGGHTSLFLVDSHISFRLLGKTRDDACGEAFDKVARMLELPYPGGAHLEMAARRGNPCAVSFPRPYLKGTLDFSFSGLKTAVYYYIKEHGLNRAADIAASFQAAVADTLVEKLRYALDKFPVRSVLFGGGVMQNRYLRSRILRCLKGMSVAAVLPAKELCADNGVSTAFAAYFSAKSGVHPADLSIEVIPTKNS